MGVIDDEKIVAELETRSCGSSATRNVLTALRAAGYVVVTAPSVYHKGPHGTDASMMLTAAEKAESARFPVGGSNVGRAVGQILREVAAQLGTRPPGDAATSVSGPSIQNIRQRVDNIADASMEEPPRIAIVDLVAALRLITNELDLRG